MLYLDKEMYSPDFREETHEMFIWEENPVTRKLAHAINHVLDNIVLRRVDISHHSFYIEICPYGKEGLEATQAFYNDIYIYLTEEGLQPENYSTVVTVVKSEEESDEYIPIQCIQYCSYNVVSEETPLDIGVLYRIVTQALSSSSKKNYKPSPIIEYISDVGYIEDDDDFFQHLVEEAPDMYSPISPHIEVLDAIPDVTTVDYSISCWDEAIDEIQIDLAIASETAYKVVSMAINTFNHALSSSEQEKPNYLTLSMRQDMITEFKDELVRYPTFIIRSEEDTPLEDGYLDLLLKSIQEATALAKKVTD